MAKIKVDTETKTVKPNETLDKIMQEKNAESLTGIKKDGTVEKITKEEANKKKAEEYTNINSNASDVKDGSVKFDLLKLDMSLLFSEFLGKFNTNTSYKYGGNSKDPDYIYFKKFPLPDYFECNECNTKHYYKPDYEDIIIIVRFYPQFAPFGIHYPENSSNASIIAHALEGHADFNNVIGNNPLNNKEYQLVLKSLETKGWKWACFHYVDAQWKFNTSKITHGDNLHKYLVNVFARLGGKKGKLLNSLIKYIKN